MESSQNSNAAGEVQLRLQPIPIEQELQSSFIDYAMSVVVSRALPDVRDGLKPVQRRILYTMHELGFTHNKPFHKSVRAVGDVLGKYHPHGDQALYGSMVNMAQDFARRYPLLQGQGNWGSIDGDNAAASRYTEVRMAKIAQELLADLDKDTVDFQPNFDDSRVEPVLLPSKLPHLLMNGTAGIAVGMATSIPPHNLTEILDASLALLDNPAIPDERLFELIPGPDFPTAAIMCGRSGVLQAYKTGRGSCTLRARIHTEETKKGTAIVVTELPYQVIKADVIVKIADLVKDKVIEGITNIRDESDKSGIRVVIELRRGEIPEVIINQLYKHTALQSKLSILMLALLDNRPVVFTLRKLLQEFLRHRQTVVYRRTKYLLRKAEERIHLLHGFVKALDQIDAVVQAIKASDDAAQALAVLQDQFGFSALQSKAILEMRLQRLTAMERERLLTEVEELKASMAYYNTVLADENVLKAEVRGELEELRNTYGDKRRTEIIGSVEDLTDKDLIPDEHVVITLTAKGYIKRVPLAEYDVQHRGGKGKMGMASLEDSDDSIQDMFAAKNHDTLLYFTNLGRVYSAEVYEVPEGSRIAKGRAIVNMLPLQEGERVVKLLCVREQTDSYLILLSRKGVIKRTQASEFTKIRSNGIRAVTLREGDELVFCSLSSGSDTVLIATAHGYGIRFDENEVRSMGRMATGVRAIKLREDDYVVGMIVASENKDILFATQRGFGKRVSFEDFRIAHRGGMGVRTIPTDKRNGLVVGLVVVDDESHILLLDNTGKIIRVSPKEVRTMGRQAKGVRLIRLAPDKMLASMSVIYGAEVEEEQQNSIEIAPEDTPEVSHDEE